jgi:riboflavin kinase / FMN adenylyltransferase
MDIRESFSQLDMKVFQLSFDEQGIAVDGSLAKACSGPQVIVIGEFDGVHAGHQEVIRRGQERAESLGIPLAIMTFHPHPREVLGHAQYARMLTPLSERLRIVHELGVHRAYVVSFNERFSKFSPEQFVQKVLIPLQPETVVVGFDFAFGHRGAGNPDTLCELGSGRFAVEVVRPVHMEGSKVGSTQIRDCLQEGRVEEANALLKRPYTIEGIVVHGAARGRQIGFPTANIQFTDCYVYPRSGVYVVRLWLNESDFKYGVANVGYKPTVQAESTEPTLEVHLFDFKESIYGAKVRTQFLSFLRDEQKFSSLDALVSQIKEDASRARAFLMGEL